MDHQLSTSVQHEHHVVTINPLETNATSHSSRQRIIYPWDSDRWILLELIMIILQIIPSSTLLVISYRDKHLVQMRLVIQDIWVIVYFVGSTASFFWTFYSCNYIRRNIPQREQDALPQVSQGLIVKKVSLAFLSFWSFCIIFFFLWNPLASSKEDVILTIYSYVFVMVNGLLYLTLSVKIEEEYEDESEPRNEGDTGFVAYGTKVRQVCAGEGECCICLENYTIGEELEELPCAHKFHVKCVDKWLKIKPSCPICKCDVGRVAVINASNDTEVEVVNQRLEYFP